MDVSAAKVQAAQLTEQAARLDRVKSGLTSYSGDMHAGWQGVEVPHISRAIDDAKKRLTTASRELREIAADIVAAANEIQAEEAAAAARAAQAAARAEAERKQREQATRAEAERAQREQAARAEAERAQREQVARTEQNAAKNSGKVNTAQKGSTKKKKKGNDSLLDFLSKFF